MSLIQTPTLFEEYLQQNAVVIVRFGHCRFLNSGNQQGAVDVSEPYLWRYLIRGTDPIFQRFPELDGAVAKTVATHNVVVLTQIDGELKDYETLLYDPTDTRPMWSVVVSARGSENGERIIEDGLQDSGFCEAESAS
jgi:hypothetical protein